MPGFRFLQIVHPLGSNVMGPTPILCQVVFRNTSALRSRSVPPLLYSRQRQQQQQEQERGETCRNYSSAASGRWKQRQGCDPYSRDAKLQGLKSRAAFKLVEINNKYRIFRPGQTVVDLGFAPGSWSQVAHSQTRPGGRTIGIDLIPAQPPAGVVSIQGDFLDPRVHLQVKRWLRNQYRQKVLQKEKQKLVKSSQNGVVGKIEEGAVTSGSGGKEEGNDVVDVTIKTESQLTHVESKVPNTVEEDGVVGTIRRDEIQTTTPQVEDMMLVDVVLSDMLMNTSGIPFKDHAASMDLCLAALKFSTETLKPGGKLVCKFYQGSEDKDLEQALKNKFEKVFREKPDSSRKESREAYFVALQRKPITQ